LKIIELRYAKVFRSVLKQSPSDKGGLEKYKKRIYKFEKNNRFAFIDLIKRLLNQ